MTNQTENTKKTQADSHFLFLDYETGGLNGRIEGGELGCESYPIFEVAAIIADSQLNEVGEPIRIVINQSEDSIAMASDWAINTHTDSGLLDEVRTSTITLRDAELKILEELKSRGIGKYCRKTFTGAILAGSSVAFDRSYMMAQMPELSDYLHYRQVDVSSVNILARVFKPQVAERVVKEYKHEALSDVRETIEELRFYKQQIFQPEK
uniref:3'-to-5' oligoribonuclease (Orn) n=2 Tax=Vibrio TaxID=662 RepID=A0A0H3ZTZ3_9VIBR|nr:3'-to-5' oligoribonuclease (orn) [Vibrio cyclitrophicus]AKN38260.1 3'-to-5' oligoribonuclease (orn) [Vibrio splendidus]